MKVTLQIIEPKSEYQKHFTTHHSLNLETDNIEKAIVFLIKRYYGYSSKVGKYDLKELPKNHHHADLFALIDVEYTAMGEELKPILEINGTTGVRKESFYTVPKKIQFTQKIRVEVKLDKKSLKMTKWQKFVREWKFNKLFKESFY